MIFVKPTENSDGTPYVEDLGRIYVTEEEFNVIKELVEGFRRK